MSRRTALAGIGAVALGLAGCTSSPAPAKPADVTISQDPLGPLYAETLSLIATYDQALASYPALAGLAGPLREENRQHATALAALMGIVAPSVSAGPDAAGRPMLPLPSPPLPPPSPGASPPAPIVVPSLGTDTATGRLTLVQAETTAQASAVTACLAAPESRAAVLASIAACRATHVAVLQ